LRIDQVITTCLKYCVPLAAICFVGAMIWKLNGWVSPHDLAPQTFGRMFAATREDWVLRAEESGVESRESEAQFKVERSKSNVASDSSPTLNSGLGTLSSVGVAREVVQ